MSISQNILLLLKDSYFMIAYLKLPISIPRLKLRLSFILRKL